mmetsp:Transcript_15923/g.21581  ORF Transcript_15923/g.21581 Transcript_15923/m.21581 type:complete len:171 (+) Transcript_15923:2992-3504(+)
MVINVVQKSKYFSKEADIVLLCLTHEHGYGNWQKIKHALKRDTRCRFDHLFMSRTVQELQKRVDILVKSLEKEVQTGKSRLMQDHSGKHQAIDKKRAYAGVAKAANVGSDVDEDMAMEDREEVGPNPDAEMVAATYGADAALHDEAKVRLGGDYVFDEREEKRMAAELAG